MGDVERWGGGENNLSRGCFILPQSRQMGEAIEVTILNALHSSGLYWLFRYSSWSTSILATWIKSKRGGEEGREREEKHCVEVYLEQSKYCPRCFELLVKFSRACLNTGTPVAPAFLGKKRERRRFYPLQRISMIAFKHQLSNDSTTKRSRLTENLTRVASISMKFHHASEIITYIYIHFNFPYHSWQRNNRVRNKLLFHHSMHRKNFTCISRIETKLTMFQLKTRRKKKEEKDFQTVVQWHHLRKLRVHVCIHIDVTAFTLNPIYGGRNRIGGSSALEATWE